MTETSRHPHQKAALPSGNRRNPPLHRRRACLLVPGVLLMLLVPFQGLSQEPAGTAPVEISQEPAAAAPAESSQDPAVPAPGEISQEPAPSSPEETAAQEAVKRVSRQRDPVILSNESLGPLFDGQPVKKVALYAYDGEKFHPVPYQFDFIGEDGLVIPSHVNRVMEKAVYDFIPNKELPDKLVPPYELLFMAKDAGVHYPGGGIPEGSTDALEIRVQDPVDGSEGWVYLRKPSSRPHRIKKDYVDYSLIKKGKQNIEQIKAERYTTGFPDADKPFAYGYWMIPPEAGGTGVDFLQTFRVRIKLKLLFWNIELDPKNNIIPYVIGYNNGPVRVTRRVFSSVVIKGIKMDALMGDAKLETESHYYGSFFFFDGEVSLPGLVKKISKIKAMFTTDFSANATGMKWYNAPNADNGGCLVDGQMSPQETVLKKEPYQWSLIVGQQGGWANILQMHTESVKPNMNLFYLDDSAYRNEKDLDLDGTWASTGYYLDKLDEVEDVVTFRTYILAIPSTFRIRETRDLENLVYHPLKVTLERTWKVGP